jgi:hypothetical protein
MLKLLEAAETFDDLSQQPDYHWFLARLNAARTTAA